MEIETNDSGTGYVRTAGDYLRAATRYKLTFFIVIAVVTSLAVVAAYMIPPVYRSSATILIEEPEVPRELVESTVTSYADQRIQLIKYRVMTSQNLKRIIDRFGLYEDLRDDTSLAAIYDRFRKDVEVETIEARVLNPRSGRAMRATIAFTVGYRSSVPSQAQQVANELVTLYLTENTRTRQVQTAATTQFLTQEGDRLAARIREAEAKLAKFKEENASRLPERLIANLGILDQSESNLEQIKRRIRGLVEQRNYLRTEIDRVSAEFPVAGKSRAMTPQQRVSELRGNIARLSRTLGPNHPELIASQRELEALQSTLGSNEERAFSAGVMANMASLVKAPAGQGEFAAISENMASIYSPHIQLRSQLNAVKVELAELQGEQRRLSRRIETYRARVSESPEIERAYSALAREYDGARSQYRAIRDKQRTAEIAEALEAERMSERFVLVEPPQLPEKPVGLAKWMFVAIGLGLGTAVASGLIFILDMFDQRIHGPRQLAAVTGLEPMLIVPNVMTPGERRQSAISGFLQFAGVGIAGAAAVVAVHYFVVPIDILWFRHVAPWVDGTFAAINRTISTINSTFAALR